VVIVLLLFGGGVLSGMLGGHWQSSLGYEEYRQLIPLVERLGH
jgi:hypothetical protein